MGIIVRQGIKTSVVNFAGAFIGMISVLFIYPLNKEVVGYANTLYSIAFFFTPFIGVGAHAVAVKYYHMLIENHKKIPSGFLVSLILYAISTCLVLIWIVYVFSDDVYFLLDKIKFNTSIFKSNEPLLILLSFILVLLSIFTAFSQLFGRNTVPNIITNFSYKIFLPIIVYLTFIGLLSKNYISSLIVGFHAVALIILGLYISRFNVFETSKVGLYKVWENKSTMLRFAFYSALTSIGSILAFKIDSIMISGLLDFKATGSYVLPMTMASIMDIPNQALIGIAGPILSKAWVDNDIKNLETIYQKSSINLMIAGVFILLIGTFCFEDLTNISSNPSVLKDVKNVFIILCIAKLTDLITSVNSSIIGYSDFYKFNLYFVLILGTSNILLNLLLIPKYGITGAAIAILISLSLFNFLKLTFIYTKFKMLPFTLESFKFLIVAIFLFLLVNIPFELSNYPFISLILKSIFLTLVYGIIVYKMKLSIELNQIIDNVFNNLRKFIQSK